MGRISHPGAAVALILWEKGFNSRLSRNGVYCTNAFLVLVKIMLGSKLHCPKVLN